MTTLSRRDFAKALGGLSLAAMTARAMAAGPVASVNQVEGYGPLIPDPARLIDLPEGFSYRVISRLGNIMDDGLPVPDNADGMGAFAMPDGRIALVRNHELRASGRKPDEGVLSAMGDAYRAYDKNDKGETLPGGTSTLIYNPATGAVEAEYMSLLGTIRNCAGGVTPWGSWLTCEEDVTRAGDKVGVDHGYIFEVPADHKGLVDPVPLKAMGRFNHEAAAVDPDTGIVYLTEDRDDSLFYRFIPTTPGKLVDGGRLQALQILGVEDSRNWDSLSIVQGQWVSTRWIDLDDVEAPNGDDLRIRGAAKGATLFARGEGIVQGTDPLGKPEFYFTCTSGGADKHGQIFRYVPIVGGDTIGESYPGGPIMLSGLPDQNLQLFFETPDRSVYSFGDNLTVAPNGDLLVCEDGYEDIVANYLRGITPEGKAYAFGMVRVQSETAGICFSPDGKTMFLNVFSPTMTLAITGPFADVAS